MGGVATTLLALTVCNGYERFYDELGLASSNVAYGPEESLVPVSHVVSIFVLPTVLSLVCVWTGAVAAYSVRRREQPVTTYLVAAAVFAMTALDWSFLGGLTELMMVAHILGILIGGLAGFPSALRKSWLGMEPERHRMREVEFNVMFIGACLVLTISGAGFFGEPGPVAALVLAVATTVMMAVGSRWLAHGVNGSLSGTLPTPAVNCSSRCVR